MRHFQQKHQPIDFSCFCLDKRKRKANQLNIGQEDVQRMLSGPDGALLMLNGQNKHREKKTRFVFQYMYFLPLFLVALTKLNKLVLKSRLVDISCLTSSNTLE